jgi:hypothetical protein
VRRRNDPWNSGELIGILDNNSGSRQPAGRGVVVVESEMSLHRSSGGPDLELVVPIKGRSRHQVHFGRSKDRFKRCQAMSSGGIVITLLIFSSQRRRGRRREQKTVDWRRHCRMVVDCRVLLIGRD